MSRWRKIVVGAAVVAAAVGGAGVASATVGGTARHDARPASAPVANPAALGDGTTESKLTPISPCRIVDTRVKGGAIGAGKSRPYKVRGTGATFANQGGKADGCGIPAAASAVQVTITAVSATGTGYLRAYPGSTAPKATFLNFKSGFNISNGGLVAICQALCSGDTQVAVYGHSSQVVIDIQGYYISPMYAFINGISGGIVAVRSSRVLSFQREGIGRYTIKFDRELKACSAQATAVSEPLTVRAFVNQDGAEVTLRNPERVLTDGLVYLSVTC